MTQISVNKQKLEGELTSNATIHDVIRHISNLKSWHQSALTNITIDGKDFDPNADDPILDHSVANFKNIDFSMRSFTQLAFEALDSTAQNIDATIGRIQYLVNCYRQNKLNEANEEFDQIINILQLFIKLMSQIHQILRAHYGTKFSSDEAINELTNHLLDALKKILPAKEKEDITLLSDLFEYELIANLEQWKERAIPQMKQFNEHQD